MNNTFNCGHVRSIENTANEYGYQRCRTCKRRNNARYARRRRHSFSVEHGRCTAAVVA